MPQLVKEISYLPRLSAEERAKSLVPSGEVRGIEGNKKFALTYRRGYQSPPEKEK